MQDVYEKQYKFAAHVSQLSMYYLIMIMESTKLPHPDGKD